MKRPPMIFTQPSRPRVHLGGAPDHPHARPITDAEYDLAQDKLDALTRTTRRGTVGTPDEIARYRAVTAAWEAVHALPATRVVDRTARDAQFFQLAVAYGLITPRG